MEQTEQPKTSFLDLVSRNFSLLAFLCFLFGYVYLSSYYNEFKVDILSHMTTVEVLYTLLPLATSVLFISVVLIYLPKNTKPQPEITPQKSHTKLQKVIRTAAYLASVFLVYWFLGIWLPEKYGEAYQGSSIVELILNVFSFYIIYERILSNVFKTFRVTQTQIIAILSLLGVLFLNFGKGKARETKRWGKRTSVVLKMKSELFTTSKTLFFIGETQSSLFFYNKLDSTTRVIKRETIDSLVIK